MKCQGKSSLAYALLLGLMIGIVPRLSWSDEKDGELLYEAHCITCHNAQVHWRQNRLVKDWTSLRSQVERWQANIGQRWTREQILDVAKYLNRVFYKFEPADQARTTRPLKAISNPLGSSDRVTGLVAADVQ
jgi:mono/diheme cytochrome c family protein